MDAMIVDFSDLVIRETVLTFNSFFFAELSHYFCLLFPVSDS